MEIFVPLIGNCFFHCGVGDDVHPRCRFHGHRGLDAEFPCPDTVLVEADEDFLVIGSSHGFLAIMKLAQPQRRR